MGVVVRDDNSTDDENREVDDNDNDWLENDIEQELYKKPAVESDLKKKEEDQVNQATEATENPAENPDQDNNPP